jgi:hypothetical protein
MAEFVIELRIRMLKIEYQRSMPPQTSVVDIATEAQRRSGKVFIGDEQAGEEGYKVAANRKRTGAHRGIRRSHDDNRPAIVKTLQDAWETGSANVTMTEGLISRREINTTDIPRTMSICSALLETRMQQMGVADPSKVTVVVAGHGDNLIEVRVWQELGATVVPMDIKPGEQEALRSRLGTVQNIRWPVEGEIPKGDIVVWNFPQSHSKFGPLTPEELTQYLNSDGILVVQGEQKKYSKPHEPEAFGPDYDTLFSVKVWDWIIISCRRLCSSILQLY